MSRAAQVRVRKPAAHRHSYRRKLQLESLEARQLLAIDIDGLTATPSPINEGQSVTVSGRINNLPNLSGLQLWLDASDPSTIVTDGSGNIQQWVDKSGRGNSASQAIDVNRPTLNSNALNGRPAVRFDGINDGLAIADSLSVARPYTIIIVDQYYDDVRGRTLQSRDANVNWLTGKWGGFNAHFANGWVSRNAAIEDFPTISTATGDAVADSSAYYVNGSILTGVAVPGDNASAAPTGTPGRLGLGSSGTFNEQSEADVAEVLVYNRVLTTTERASVEKYLAAKYGITYYDTFTGADAGEGLDLDGDFVYAVNVQDPPGASIGPIRDVTFTNDATPGVTVTANVSANGWNPASFGTTTNDDSLEAVLSSIRYQGGSLTVDMANLVVGSRYKLQLLLDEGCCSTRGFDVFVEGKLLFDNYNTLGSLNPALGGVLVHEFVATDSVLNVSMSTAGNFFGDQNIILNAFTLEDLSGLAPTTAIGTFSGGDAGEGLDLDGTFAYAINVGGSAAGPVRNATFTADTATPGASVTAVNQITNFGNANFGSNANDDAMEAVSSSIRWTPSPGGVTANLDVTPGTRYKLQLLFQDTGTGRGFDVRVEDRIIADNFSPGTVQQSAGALANFGAVITHELTAADNQLNLFMQNASSGVPASFGDNNPILSAITLETIPAPPAPPIPPENTVVIDWADGSAPTTLPLAPGQFAFSASHTYVDNKPDGQPSGVFVPLVTVTNSAGETASSAPIVAGDGLVNRANNDAPGYTFALNEPIADTGRVTQWSYYDNEASTIGLNVTPLLLERVGGSFFIRGIGTPRASNGAGSQTFDFGLVSGTDVVSNRNFFIGWKDGTPTTNTNGVIDWDPTAADNGVFYFAQNLTLSTNQNLGGGTFDPRDYSIQFVVQSSAAVIVNNVAPTATVGGPFTTTEGNGTVVLSATATDPAGANDTFTFTWDLDNDGIYGETGAGATRGNETGATPTFSAVGLDGPGVFPVSVRATDNDGGVGLPSTTNVTITNVAPTVSITGPSSTSPGFTTTFNLAASDVSPADQAGNFTYTIDWGDDSPNTTFTAGANTTASHAYEDLGPYTITVTATDKDGAVSAVDELDINVQPVSVIDGTLIISGTSSNDRIILQPGGAGVTLRYNNKLIAAPAFNQKIVIIGGAGDDTITVGSGIGAPVEIYGGEGNDYLSGGRGNDLLDGGADNDRLFGNLGDDSFLGGDGNDTITGGVGHDTADGGAGNDTVGGDAGNDTLLGGSGDDRLNGGANDDYLDGGADNDRLDGNTGNDLLLGRTGGDQLTGGAGHDVLFGGSEGDILRGGTGDDLLAGDTTSNDLNAAALALIWSQWAAGGSSAQPGLAASFNDTTIPTNDGFDTLLGEAGVDWFLYFLSDTFRDARTSDIKTQLT